MEPGSGSGRLKTCAARLPSQPAPQTHWPSAGPPYLTLTRVVPLITAVPWRSTAGATVRYRWLPRKKGKKRNVLKGRKGRLAESDRGGGGGEGC